MTEENPTKRTLNRVGANVVVWKHPIANTYTIIEQQIEGMDKDAIIINDNEIDDLIDVLKDYREAIRV